MLPNAINSIKLPVGRSGVNNRDDVKIVQQLLNRVIAAIRDLPAGVSKLDADGVCGAVTTGAIEKVQQAVLVGRRGRQRSRTELVYPM